MSAAHCGDQFVADPICIVRTQLVCILISILPPIKHLIQSLLKCILLSLQMAPSQHCLWGGSQFFKYLAVGKNVCQRQNLVDID